MRTCLFIVHTRTRVYIQTPLYENINRLVHRVRVLRGARVCGFFFTYHRQRTQSETNAFATFERSVIDE